MRPSSGSVADVFDLVVNVYASGGGCTGGGGLPGELGDGGELARGLQCRMRALVLANVRKRAITWGGFWHCPEGFVLGFLLDLDPRPGLAVRFGGLG